MQELPLTDLLKRKREAKKSLCRELSCHYKKPLMAIFLDNEISAAEESQLKSLLEATENIDVEVVILADSNPEILSFAHTVVIPYSRINRQKLLNAADMALTFSFNDVEEMFLNGIIPISAIRPEVKNYDPNRESGNSFVYKKQNHWSIFASMIRAIEAFRFPYDWKHIVRQGVSSIK